MPTQRSRTSDKVTIKIPRPLYDKIAVLIDGAGYNSVTDFIVYVLRDLAGHHTDKSERLCDTEIEKIRQRLETLGYL